jgi:hypothetical protein
VALVVFVRGGVGCFDEGLPCALDVLRVAVVGRLIDEDADVVVAGLVGIAVVELVQ